MSALAIAHLLGHWEARRLRALDRAHAVRGRGFGELVHLRDARRAEARRDKLQRLLSRASLPRACA